MKAQTETLEMIAQCGRCDGTGEVHIRCREEDHDWVTEPGSGGLIDVCTKCGEGRA